MNRITPEQVLEAYQKTGINPMRNDYCYLDDNGEKCGCAITALLTDKIGWEDTNSAIYTKVRLSAYISEELGLESDYVEGFIYGFDGFSARKNTQGYVDGAQAKELVGEKIGFKFESGGN